METHQTPLKNQEVRPLDEQELICWLRLIRSENIGPVLFQRLIRQYQRASLALMELPNLALSGGKTTRLKICSEERAVQELEALTKFGAQLLPSCDPLYPQLLKEAPAAPPLLTIKGRAPLLTERLFAVVGARNASLIGKKMAATLATKLSENGWSIVSGLARGVDACAHKAALETGTVAAIAGGIDQIYPPENERLYYEIAERGLIVTESPFGIKPQANLFPKRNRIISGLSQATLVVEAAFKSGSLVTARYALEQGRDVYAVPGSPMDPRARGTNHLIRQGAILTERYEDIERELAAGPMIAKETTEIREEIPETRTLDLDPVRKILLENLNYTPIRVDNLLEEYQIPHDALWALLLELEIAGRLNRLPGGFISLKPSQRE